MFSLVLQDKKKKVFQPVKLTLIKVCILGQSLFTSYTCQQHMEMTVVITGHLTISSDGHRAANEAWSC